MLLPVGAAIVAGAIALGFADDTIYQRTARRVSPNESRSLEKADTMALIMHAQRDNNSKPAGRRTNKGMERVLVAHYHRFCPQEVWTPSVNLYEDDRQYVVIADLAGVKWDSIDIRVDDKGVLALSGCRSVPEVPVPAGQVKLHLMEIDYGSFCRSLDLPDDAYIQAIPDALYKSGFLYVSIPKRAPATGRRTAVKVPGHNGKKHC